MEPSQDNSQPPVSSRRDLLKLAVTAGAGLAFGSAATPGQAAATGEPGAEAPKPVSYKFTPAILKPQVDNAGGSVIECDKRVFPVVEKGGASLFLLRLAPGGLREPHWHPDCWELDYVVAGTVRMIVVPPAGPVSTFTLEPGEIAFIPQGLRTPLRISATSRR